MCGIWGHFRKIYNSDDTARDAKAAATFDENDTVTSLLLVHRGPDETKKYATDVGNLAINLTFHRLAIIDIQNGHQPFVVETPTRTVVLLANGEIYNYKNLRQKYSLDTTSDCKVILDLYLQFGALETCRLLEGEFAFVIVDIDKIAKHCTVSLARDRFGIRPLFIGVDADMRNLFFSSEVKGIPNSGLPALVVSHVPPRAVLQYTSEDDTNTFLHTGVTSYYDMNDLQVPGDSVFGVDVYPRADILEKWCLRIRKALVQSVKDRLDTERPLGCLLSGGLDSSLIAGIAARELNQRGQQLHTFSIGLTSDSPDIIFAREVARHIGSKHHEVVIPHEVWIENIPTVIKQIETYDTTTVRASTAQFLVAQWISQNTDIKVILNGDGSDEITGGYLYFYNAPDPKSFHNECVSLLSEIHYYDVLRVDRGISAHGLEARVPFLCHRFVETYLQSPVEFRRPQAGVQMEKYLLRKSFEGTDIIPDSVLWRRKEAFSDGVSGQQKSWYELIEQSIPTDFSYDPWKGFQITDTYKVYQAPLPISRESQYYRNLFDSFYPTRTGILETGKYWLPKWCGAVVNPSARILKVYTNQM